ncbi:ATP-binding protein [Acidovorax sp. BLS4]|uniref:ATP-binding protein n=1 Tax=Acidovorax sp. BLS4 TaxID=3273430 RepID=UPI002942966E|nr:ATP-binding protein [Paracidovorax avenae]WOI44956.1 ATP-binding protein [Paracidovorax avenae]
MRAAATASMAPARAGWRRWLPDTLFGRLALLLFVAVTASHVLALTLMFELRPAGMGPPPPPGAAMDGDAARRPPPARPPEPGGPSRERRPGFLHAGLALDIGVRLLALMLAAWWGARWLSQPIHRLARAARDLGGDLHGPPLPEDGPAECREASRVFNQMQARIRQQLAERDGFVAAVSHDLRTPLTRLRLRAETLHDDGERERFCRDIGEMDAMITATLDHLRGVAHAEPVAPLDIGALLQSLVDDAQDCGHAVTLQGSARPLPARVGALRRCIGNLVGNAVRYGGGAEITLSEDGAAVRIAVRDHGPGLPEQELDRVMQPFYRVEGSRNRHSGGVGLGLSIAHDIAQRHGGSLQLGNAPGGGLVATVTLPRGDGNGDGQAMRLL